MGQEQLSVRSWDRSTLERGVVAFRPFAVAASLEAEGLGAQAGQAAESLLGTTVVTARSGGGPVFAVVLRCADLVGQLEVGP
jgi:hypothetical protein